MIPKTSIYKARLQEIELAMSSADLNRVSRRTLDITHDFACNESLQKQSLILRKEYNISKELGASGNENNSLRPKFEELLLELNKIDPEISASKNQKEVICIANEISKNFPSFKLNPITIKLKRGNIVGLVGENGNGKTTLLRLLAGELHSDHGIIQYYDGDTEITSWEKIKKEVAFIPQRLDRWWGTVEEQISFAASVKGKTGEENAYATDFIIQRLGLTKFQNHTWAELSSGYKLRVEIAKTLVWNPRVLILDEPLANLDLLAQELLLQDIKDLASSLSKPVAIVLSSQQLHEVETVADQIIFLKNGRAIFNGSTDTLHVNEDFHTIEIEGKFSYKELVETLGDLVMNVEKKSSSYTVTFSKDFESNKVLALLLSKNMEVVYYRNITNSTKKLFSDKY